VKVIQCEQGSPEWFKARRGLPTASRFDMIITPKTCKISASQDRLINQLIAETFANEWPDTDGYVSPAMEHGKQTESTARALYEFENNLDVQQVGLCVSDCGRFGGSPDGLIGDDGGIEIKCPDATTHVGYLRDGVLPSDYRCQVHGYLVITGRKWWDFISYCEGLPAFVVRVVPDDFTAALTQELDHFCERYRVELEKIRAKFN